MTQDSRFAVAMDWGGTWNRVAVVDQNGAVHWQTRVANSLSHDTQELLAAGEAALRDALSWCGSQLVAGIGLALAGPVDPETGILDQPPNLPMLDGISPKAIWTAKLGLPVWVGNDADLAALGEYYFGAGKGEGGTGPLPRTLVYLTLSTGIGGGVVYRGQVFLGANGLAAEIGHMVIDSGPSAPMCNCGRRGCLEAFASGTAVARTAREQLNDGGNTTSILSGGRLEDVTSERVFQAAGQGDPLALSVVDGVVAALGMGLTNILHLYNPDVLVLGGGVSRGIEDLDLMPRIHSIILEQAMSGRHKQFRFALSKLKDSAGILGAATLVWINSGATQ